MVITYWYNYTHEIINVHQMLIYTILLGSQYNEVQHIWRAEDDALYSQL